MEFFMELRSTIKEKSIIIFICLDPNFLCPAVFWYVFVVLSSRSAFKLESKLGIGLEAIFRVHLNRNLSSHLNCNLE